MTVEPGAAERMRVVDDVDLLATPDAWDAARIGFEVVLSVSAAAWLWAET